MSLDLSPLVDSFETTYWRIARKLASIVVVGVFECTFRGAVAQTARELVDVARYHGLILGEVRILVATAAETARARERGCGTTGHDCWTAFCHQHVL